MTLTILFLMWACVATVWAILATSLYLAWRWAAQIRLDDAEYWKKEATARGYNKEVPTNEPV